MRRLVIIGSAILCGIAVLTLGRPECLSELLAQLGARK